MCIISVIVLVICDGKDVSSGWSGQEERYLLGTYVLLKVQVALTHCKCFGHL